MNKIVEFLPFMFRLRCATLAPAGTPRAIIDRLRSEIVGLLKESDTRQRLAALGSDPVGSTPAEFKAKIQRELQEFEKIIKALGLKP